HARWLRQMGRGEPGLGAGAGEAVAVS
ncbi:MAG: hypothetical protein QOK40_1883, partial [Miltoncostaeaceae bacterium]|nr:hypothetical protein [Miltoncostaeaceae bacterium]